MQAGITLQQTIPPWEPMVRDAAAQTYDGKHWSACPVFYLVLNLFVTLKAHKHSLTKLQYL